jgi:hypothetical protein
MSQQPLAYATATFRAMPAVTLVRQNVVWLGMTLIAMLSAPGFHPGWSLFWLVVAALLSAMCLTEIHIARAIEHPRTALTTFGAAALSALVALVLSMALNPLSGLMLILLLGVLSYTGRQRPFVTAALTVALVPWWVWMALDQWHWQLLVLFPLVGMGLVAVNHLLDAHAWPDDAERIMPARAHRAAAWLIIALSGIVLMLLGLMTDASRPFLALAGIVLALSVPLEAGFGSTSRNSARQSIRIVVSAYLIAMACWLIGIA